MLLLSDINCARDPQDPQLIPISPKIYITLPWLPCHKLPWLAPTCTNPHRQWKLGARSQEQIVRSEHT